MDLHRSPSRCGLQNVAPITDTLSNSAAAGDAGMMRHRHNISRYRCCFGCHSSRNPLTIIAALRSNESAAMNQHAMQWTCRLLIRVESKAIIGAADPQAATPIMSNMLGETSKYGGSDAHGFTKSSAVSHSC